MACVYTKQFSNSIKASGKYELWSLDPRKNGKESKVKEWNSIKDFVAFLKSPQAMEYTSYSSYYDTEGNRISDSMISDLIGEL